MGVLNLTRGADGDELWIVSSPNDTKASIAELIRQRLRLQQWGEIDQGVGIRLKPRLRKVRFSETEEFPRVMQGDQFSRAIYHVMEYRVTQCRLPSPRKRVSIIS